MIFVGFGIWRKYARGTMVYDKLGAIALCGGWNKGRKVLHEIFSGVTGFK